MQATIEHIILGINAEIFHHQSKAVRQSPLNKHLAIPFCCQIAFVVIICAQQF